MDKFELLEGIFVSSPKKVLYILSSFNIFGGTPKKTLDLMSYFSENSVLYVYEKKHVEFKSTFLNTGGRVYEGYHGRKIFKHLAELLRIVDREQVGVIQTQFPMGELLGFFLKLMRPKVKLVIAFVGSTEPSILKKRVAEFVYKRVDAVVYISKYVKSEKEKQFPVLSKVFSRVIYNGSEKRLDNGVEVRSLGKKSVLSVSSLIELKNIQIVIEAFNILVNEFDEKDVKYYIAGKGAATYEKNLNFLIDKYDLKNHIFLLGAQKNIGSLLRQAEVFVHPSYKEGFGIAVAEAMLAGKPIIVSDAGALPELIDDGDSGIVVPPFDARLWAEKIHHLLTDKAEAEKMGNNAKKKASEAFCANRFRQDYETFYLEIGGL